MKGIAILKKEWVEAVRSYRILLVPIIFLFLGISQPLSYYYMPEILDIAGLPEGVLIEFPPPENADIIAGVLAQYNQIGILMILLIGMGTINREIEGGLAGFVTSLGISRLTYVVSKWIVLAFISIISVVVGIFAAAYYTSTLFQPVDWLSILQVALVYSLHAVMVSTITLLLSGCFASLVTSAGIGILVFVSFSVLSTVFKSIANWLPNQAGYLAQEMLYGGVGVLFLRILVTVLWIFVLLGIIYWVIQKKEI